MQIDRESKAHIPRVIRVFISSTFRDMHEERDELVKHVFPQLRKLCEKRGVVWGEVDLRWGITDEERSEGKVLPVCLEEIQRCRPYFIGLLGERYGWVPDEIPQDLIEREDWLKEHQSKSVTELEILHGVLNNPEMAGHAFFYFRDPQYIDTLSPEKKQDYQESPTIEEIEKYGTVEAKRRADERISKLTELKNQIRNYEFPVRENFKDPQELGKAVLEDITSVINKLFPEGSEPDPLVKITSEHESYAQSRYRIYIGRKEYFDTLDNHVESDAAPLVIIGDSGSGKSALLANWAINYREKHPDEFILTHFIGANPDATNWMFMLRRIMEELKRRFDISGDIPDKPDALRMAFTNWLHMASAKGRAVIILDALNQLEDRDGAPDLVWLPPVIPPGIRLILSTLPGRPLDDLKKRGWRMMEVHPLDKNECKLLINEYLAQYSRKLSESRIEKIATVKQAHNPLYLRTLLDELRVFGIHEKLEEKIDHYLSAKTIPELYEKILERYEDDYERERAGLVRDSMSAICSARRGLAEKELLEILGENGDPLSQAVWAPLYLVSEPALVNRSGLMGFSHDYMRQAVLKRYLPTELDQQNVHMRLAEYFAKFEFNNRVIDELQWQLASAKSWQKLYDLLSDHAFFVPAWQLDHVAIKEYWTQIENESDLHSIDAYKQLIDAAEIEGLSEFANIVSIFLKNQGHISESLSIRQKLTEYFRKTKNKTNLQDSLGRQGHIYFLRGEFDEAMNLYIEQEKICLDLGNKQGLSHSYGRQADINIIKGEFDEAMRLLKEDERLCRESGNKIGLSFNFDSQAQIHHARGELDAAMSILREDERMCREIGNKFFLSLNLGNQSSILFARGEIDKAMSLQKNVLDMCREQGEKQFIAASLGNYAVSLRVKGNLEEATKLHNEEEAIYRQINDKIGLAESLGNQAVINRLLGKLDDAMKLHLEEEEICREIPHNEGIAKSLVNQGLVWLENGNIEQSLKLAEESYQMAIKQDFIRLLEEEINPALEKIRAQLK